MHGRAAARHHPEQSACRRRRSRPSAGRLRSPPPSRAAPAPSRRRRASGRSRRRRCRRGRTRRQATRGSPAIASSARHVEVGDLVEAEPALRAVPVPDAVVVPITARARRSGSTRRDRPGAHPGGEQVAPARLVFLHQREGAQAGVLLARRRARVADQALLGDQDAGAAHLAVVALEAAAHDAPGRPRRTRPRSSRSELGPGVLDRFDQDLEQALLLRFEVVVERRRPQPDGRRHVRPLACLRSRSRRSTRSPRRRSRRACCAATVAALFARPPPCQTSAPPPLCPLAAGVARLRTRATLHGNVTSFGGPLRRISRRSEQRATIAPMSAAEPPATPLLEQLPAAGLVHPQRLQPSRRRADDARDQRDGLARPRSQRAANRASGARPRSTCSRSTATATWSPRAATPSGSATCGPRAAAACAWDARPRTSRRPRSRPTPRVPVLRAYLKKWKWEVGAFFDGVGPDSTDAAAPRDRPRPPGLQDRRLTAVHVPGRRGHATPAEGRALKLRPAKGRGRLATARAGCGRGRTAGSWLASGRLSDVAPSSAATARAL